MTTRTGEGQSAAARHEHRFFKFYCYEEAYKPYSLLFVCFGCSKAFTQKISYEEVLKIK
jgi:hypothetical protein